MKNREHRQPVERLFVLGAGASFALSNVALRKREFARSATPLDKDFLARLTHFQPSRGWQRSAIELLDAQRLDGDSFAQSGLEQAVIKRVSQYDFLSSLHPKRVRGKIGNAQYINILSHVITDSLLKCKSNSSGETKRFINWLFPIGHDPSDYRNRVITFNYDTLIERPLIERGVSKKKLYFDRIASRVSDGTRRNADERFPHPLILKLHGSVNWRCSNLDYAAMINGELDPASRIVIWSEDQLCPEPEDAVSPLIMPPIPNKPITANSIFRHLWTTAYEYLHQAEELIIVGYSCPFTDTLARTMFTHFEAEHLKRVTVVDPDGAALARYRDLIPRDIAASARWGYFSDFREYIRHEVP